MAIQTKDLSVGGNAYKSTQFPARRGDVLFARLMRLIGPLVGGLVAGVAAGKDSGDGDGVSVDHIASALQAASHIDPQEFSQLQVDLLESTSVNNQMITPEVFDMHFAGNYAEKFRVLGFVVDLNFGSVFGAGGIGGLTARMLQTKAASQQGSSATN